VNDSTIEKMLIHSISKFPPIEIIDIFSGGIPALERLHKLKPDICIVDVDDPNIANVEVAELGVGVAIAITSDIERSYALIDKGFYDVVASRDISFEMLFRRVNRLLKFIYHFVHKYQPTEEKQTTPSAPAEEIPSKDSLFVRFNKKSVKVNLRDILYVRNINHALELSLTNGQVLQHSCTMKKFMKSLPSNQFVRINNATIVNHKKINEISKKELNVGGKKFIVSKSYVDNLKKVLQF
jgi:DNA-binding LytR/AlgR family response regulator